jgi:site-specific recombinase XerC
VASKAPWTIELYSQSVRCFSRWLAELAELAEACEPSTVATRLRGMRRFCRWLVVDGEIDKAPTKGSGMVDPDRSTPARTAATVHQLLDASTRYEDAGASHCKVALGWLRSPLLRTAKW